MATFTGIGRAIKDFVIDTLTTSNKTIPGAINELNSNITTNITTNISWNKEVITDAPSGCQLFKTSQLYNLKVFFKSAISLSKDGVYLLGIISQSNAPAIQTNCRCDTFSGISGYIVISIDGKINFTPTANIGTGYWIYADAIYCR